MSLNNKDISKNNREEYLKECAVNNINLYEQADCANQLGKLYYGYAETMPLSIKYYLLAYKINSDNPEYIHNLSRAYYLVEDFEKAEPFLKKCTEVDIPNLEKSICAAKLSCIYRNKAMSFEVINYLELAHKLEPKNPQYIYPLALEHRNIGNYSETERLLQKCFDADKTDMLDRNTIASCAKDLKKLSLLLYKIDAYNISKSLSLKCVEPRHEEYFTKIDRAECANLLGHLYLTDKKFTRDSIENTVDAYNLAKQLDPQNPIYNYNLAFTYYTFNYNVEETASVLKECLDANYTKQFTNIEKAKCANKLGTLYYDGKLKGVTPVDSVDKIIKYYKYAYELNNNNAYLYNLGLTYFYAGLYNDAFSIVKECKENLSNSFSPSMQEDCHNKYLDLIGIYLSEKLNFDYYIL